MSKGVTIADLCKLVNRERRTVERRLSAVVPREDGTYESCKALAAIYAKDFEQKKTADIEISEARIAAANARRAEARAAKEEGAVIEVSVVSQAWLEVAVVIAQKLELIPTKFESRYVMGMEAKDARAIIEQELEDVRSDLSKPISYKEPEGAAEDTEPDAESFGPEAETSD